MAHPSKMNPKPMLWPQKVSSAQQGMAVAALLHHPRHPACMTPWALLLPHPAGALTFVRFKSTRPQADTGPKNMGNNLLFSPACPSWTVGSGITQCCLLMASVVPTSHQEEKQVLWERTQTGLLLIQAYAIRR